MTRGTLGIMRRMISPAFWFSAAIALAPLTARPQAVEATPPEMVLFSAPCGLSFLHPAGWTVKADPEERCGFRASAPGEDGGTIAISTKESCSFELEASEAGFTYIYGEWAFEEMPEVYVGADAISHPLMWGLKAEFTGRCYDEDGYTGQCSLYRALLADEHQRCIVMQGDSGSWEVFEPVMASARLPFRDFELNMAIESLLVAHHGAGRVIAGLHEPDPALWRAFLDSVAGGGLVDINVAASLAPAAKGNAATELADAVRRAFVAGSSYVLGHVPEVFPFEAICRPPDSLTGDARETWMRAAEAVLVKYETAWHAPASLVRTCRDHVRGASAR